MSKDRNPFSSCRDLIAASRKLCDLVDTLPFSEPVTHVYNPLRYARKSHEQFLALCNIGGTQALYLGMNPGPWGMAQTGVPFGEISAVRDFLNIQCPVNKPTKEHPKRPIEGFACKRSEVSGARLWKLFADRFGSPACFFSQNMVLNYCPLVFMEASGKNRTPDKIRATESDVLHRYCDWHLQTVIHMLRPRYVVGVGAYAYECLLRVRDAIGQQAETDKRVSEIQVHKILHPSPASPAANKDWAGVATAQLQAAGIW